MTFQDVIRRVSLALEDAGIPYMLTGSFASSFHGDPRATKDIDIVIAPTEEGLRRFVSSFPSEKYYVSPEAAEDAFRRRTLFNVIDFETGWKIDFILRKGRAFSEEEFRRRSLVEYSDLKIFIASPEDIILAKLEWSAEGGSSRQIEDAAGVIRMRGSELDFDYIRGWVEKLGLDEQWKRIDPTRDAPTPP